MELRDFSVIYLSIHYALGLGELVFTGLRLAQQTEGHATEKRDTCQQNYP